MFSSCKLTANSASAEEDEHDAIFLCSAFVASLPKGLLPLQVVAEGDQSPTKELAGGAKGSTGNGYEICWAVVLCFVGCHFGSYFMISQQCINANVYPSPSPKALAARDTYIQQINMTLAYTQIHTVVLHKEKIEEYLVRVSEATMVACHSIRVI
jgi:hypothetical protein